MNQLRPSVFIGSSAEGLSVAEAIQLNLDRVCDCMIWSQGVFGLSAGTLETLVGSIDNFDFAILVLSPDDLVESRKKNQPSPRDNVLLELGIFIGGIGRERTFVVCDRTVSLKLPTDLAGITLATYQLQSSGNFESSLGAPCTQLKKSIQSLGARLRRVNSTDVVPTTQFQIICDLLEEAAKQFLIFIHVNQLSLVRDPIWSQGVDYTYAMVNTALGHGQFSVDGLCNKLPDAGLLSVDLRNNVSLTERGHDYAQWLIGTGKKALYFECPLGTWGALPTDMKKYLGK